MTTHELITWLSENAPPVRRLRPPWVRTCIWLLLVAAVFVLLDLSQGVRSDLAQRAGQPVFVVGVAASLATAILAALSSFMTSMPDRSNGWTMLPFPTLLLWIATIGYGCLAGWVGIGPGGVRLDELARCFRTVVLVSVPLSIALYFMLRHAAFIRPATVTLTASLVVAAMTSTALSLFHDFDASIMILAWNLGVAAIIVAAGGVLGLRARTHALDASTFGER